MTPLSRREEYTRLLDAFSEAHHYAAPSGEYATSREALESFLAPLLNDAERIEWLDSQRQPIVSNDGYGEHTLEGYLWPVEGECTAIRQAIDAARSASSDRETP